MRERTAEQKTWEDASAALMEKDLCGRSIAPHDGEQNYVTQV